MKIDFKINMQDVNSDYINREIEEFSQTHAPGLSVIQQVDTWHDSVTNNIEHFSNSNKQLIIVTSNDEVYEKIPVRDYIVPVKGTVEDAKLYVNFSHFIIIAAHQKISIDALDVSWQNQDIILCDFKDIDSVDSKIYKYFYDGFDIPEAETAGFELYDKLVKENAVLLPSNKLFVHEFNDRLSFRMNIWLQQLLGLASVRGELKKSGSVTVHHELDRGFPSSPEALMIIISHIDDQLQKRYDTDLTEMLNHFNKQFTVPLKNMVDRGEIDKETLINGMKEKGIRNIYYKALNKGDAKKLVLAYCFPPYNDTSGNVMAKRIHESGGLADIISNNMDRIRTRDDKLLNLVSELVDSQIMLDGPQAFSSWGSIESYMHDGYRQFLTHQEKYDEIYSRAMFTQSHFLGYEIKKNHPDLKWVAEFSDPLHKDVNAQMRYAPVEDDEYITEIKENLDAKYHGLINDNVFNLCEVLPFIYADELVFTNKHQLEYMIERFDPALQDIVMNKATVSQHPTPSKPMYDLVQSYYKLDGTTINLAYFGNFYDTRGFRQIELVAKQLYDQNINNFKIHVFTNLKGNTMRFYKGSDFKEYITLNPYVSYFEFLNLADRLDILMIFDAETIGIKPFNPYVPSKLSDYRGSDSFVWAFTEAGSILDQTAEDNIAITRQHEYHEYAPTFETLAGRLNKDLYRADMITCSK